MRVNPKCLPLLIQEELFLLNEEKPIVAPKPSKPEEKTPATKMLVVVDSLESANKAIETDSFLSKVLGAVQVDVNEVQIQSPEEFIEGSLAEFKWALFFGVQDLLKTPIIPYQVVKDPCNHMVIDSLKEIESQREKKAKLWNGLQKMFDKGG